MMSTGTPGSRLDGPGPADLLWRQRFLNQHAHLLGRMNSLEEKEAIHNERTKKAEQAAKACNAAFDGIKELEQQVDALQRDEEQQKQNEKFSKMLSQQMRDTAMLRERMAKLEGLEMKCHSQEEDLHELRQKVEKYVGVIRVLEAEVQTLQMTVASDTETNSNAVRDIVARLEHLDRRNELQDRQIKHMATKLEALETGDKRLGADRSSPTLLNSSQELGGFPPPNQPGVVPRPTPTKKIARRGCSAASFQQNAQVTTLISETQTSTQVLNSLGVSDEGGDGPSFAHNHRSAYDPRKKPRLDTDTPQQVRSPKSSCSTIATQRPQKIVVLPIAYTQQQSSSVAPTWRKRRPQPSKRTPVAAVSLKKLPKEHTTDASIPKQEPGAETNETLTQLTQSQTVQFLRRSARNLGPGETTDTQHIELGYDSAPRPVQFPLKASMQSRAPDTPSKATFNRSRGALIQANVYPHPSRSVNDGLPRVNSGSSGMTAATFKTIKSEFRPSNKRKRAKKTKQHLH